MPQLLLNDQNTSHVLTGAVNDELTKNNAYELCFGGKNVEKGIEYDEDDVVPYIEPCSSSRYTLGVYRVFGDESSAWPGSCVAETMPFDEVVRRLAWFVMYWRLPEMPDEMETLDD